MLFSYPVVASALISAALGDSLRKDQYCLDAIYEALGYQSFEGSSPDDYWGSACQNRLRVGSMYAAGLQYCTDDEINAGSSLLSGYCEEYGSIELLPVSEFKENLTTDYIKTIRVIDYEEIPATENITTIVIISPSYFGTSHRTVATWEFEMWTHHTYGFAMYGFWGSILLLGIIANTYNTFWHSRMSGSSTDIEKIHSAAQTSSPSGKVTHWLKTNIVISTLFGTHRRRHYHSWAIPTRGEFLIITAFWSLSLTLCSINFKTFEGNLYWATIPPQVWRYVADRTGIMAYSNLSVLWMFSGRNNVFMWATGWDYAMFNMFHRHIARVATLEAIVHSVAYTVMYKDDGYYTEELTEAWFYLGITAIVSMSSLLLFSSVWLRKKFYEIFLFVHIAFSVLVIVSLFYHTSVFDGEYNPYLWPLVAIWSFDRALRVIRLLYCNVRLGLSKKMLQTSKSVVTYDKAADVIKIVFTPAHTLLRPKPGQFYYIYQPLSWKGWENHPFTLGSYSRPGQVPRSEITAVWDKCVNFSEQAVSETPTSASSFSMNGQRDDGAIGSQNLIFWVRPFDGWTKSLAKSCQRGVNGISKSRILIEGPYGHSANLHNYESLLLIAGGTGISAVLPYIEEHIHRQSTVGQSDTSSSPRTREIDLLWSSRNPEFIHDLCKKELRPALTREDIHTNFFSTSAVPNKRASTEADKIELCKGIPVQAEINQGRPDITTAILEAAQVNVNGGSNAGRLAILVCGPAGMADEARAAVHQAMKGGCQSIEYIEETFGW